MNTATPSRIKPHLRRWLALKAPVQAGMVIVSKINTTVMPVDFMTKSQVALEGQGRSGIAYLTNSIDNTFYK